MSGHSKWHNIKHKKAAGDAKKSKIYTKIAKLIEIAAKSGPDPKLNPALDTVLIKARTNNLPKEVIERAIKKGSGQGGGENLEQIFYEGYGPGGTAIYIKAITSNKNRASANIRSLLGKLGASMGEPGSVSWQFKEKGSIFAIGISEKKNEKGKEVEKILPLDMEKLEEDLIEIGAEDYEILEDGVQIYTDRADFTGALKLLEEKNYKIDVADLEFIPENYMAISDTDAAKLERLIDSLEDDEDVDSIYHNAE